MQSRYSIRLAFGSVISALALALTTTAQAEQTTAIRGSDFLNSIGTQAAISVRGENLQKTTACIKYLGVRWLRAGIEGNVPVSQFVQLHKDTGVKFSWGLGSGGTDLAQLVITAKQIADAGALLSFEGPNEPNNWGFKYQGQSGGRDQSWIPVANLMRDLYKTVKSDPMLKKYPVWSITENGAETNNAGLQFLTIPNGAHADMPDGTTFADYANVHNYIYHPNSPGVEDNKTWKAADPGPACKVDGLYGEYGVTWAKHYQGYSERDLLTLLRVTTETGCAIDGPVTEDVHGLNLLSLYLDQFKRGWSYTCNYLMRDRVDEAGNQQFGFYRPDYTPRKAALYLHNLTTILADTGVRSVPGALGYSIANEPATVHDMLLQKSDGTFDLIVWGERVKGSDDVTVSLGKTFPIMKLYDVTHDAAPLLTLNNVSEFDLTLSDHPMIIELPGTAPKPRPRPTAVAFPLKVSPNGRYLVDQHNRPFLIAGDVPQSLMVQLAPAESDAYFADRQRYGFNTLWINAVNAAPYFPDSRVDGSTYDGNRPFEGYLPGGNDTAHYDLTKPNEIYFRRVDQILDLAAKRNLLVFLDPIETGQWLTTLRNNGTDAAAQYGKFLGNRYKKYENLVWLNGNDFGTWRNSADDAVVQAVAGGIRSAAPRQLQTVELNGDESLQDPSWRPLISLNGCYTYGVTYQQMLQCYHQSPAMPCYLLESHYENEDVGDPKDYGTPAVVRRQAYWAMLTGGVGQLYGNMYTWRMQTGWKDHIDTPGAAQFTIWKSFFTSLPWYDLVPDETHAIVTAGLGSMGDGKLRVSESDFCTAAASPDGSCMVAYMPTERTITVNIGRMKSTFVAKWFDPTSGAYSTAAGSPFVNKGARVFTPPGKNNAGDGDWVLVLTANKHV